MAGEMVRQALVCDVQNDRQQSAKIGFVTPPQKRDCGIAALSRIHFLILIPSAVIHAVAVDDREVLNDQVFPCVVHQRFRRFHSHCIRQKVLPGVDASLPLSIVGKGCDILRGRAFFRLGSLAWGFGFQFVLPRVRSCRGCGNRDGGELIRRNPRVRALALPGPRLVKISQRCAT